MQFRRQHKNSQGGWLAVFRIAPLLATVFLSAQILATAHSAAHAENDHLHDGVPCIIATASKQYDAVDVAKTALEVTIVSNHQTRATGPSLALVPVVISIRSIRAPPAFS